MKRFPITALLVLLMALTGCLSQTTLGGGGSVVTGSARDAELATADGGSSTSGSKSQGEAQELIKCSGPIATVALVEDDSFKITYTDALNKLQLPPSPIPLLRLMFQQTGCFQIVDRGQGLTAISKEQQLADQGLLRKDSYSARGQLVAADYTITPNLVFSEDDAGGAAVGGLLSNVLPGVNTLLGGVSMSSKEAQVVLFLTDNRSGIQVASAEGSAKTTDIGFGALGLIGGLGAAGGAWGKTNQGKVIVAALLDATNKIVGIIRS